MSNTYIHCLELSSVNKFKEELKSVETCISLGNVFIAIDLIGVGDRHGYFIYKIKSINKKKC